MSSSPKPSTKDYNNLDSPYGNNASPEDGVHDANFFRASPMLKQVAPRSPKVHPHRLKASPGTPASPLPSPSITKHEMLTRKRHERRGGGASTPAGAGEEGEREVTGSSGSCSTAKTPATTTTKAEINLAKPPDSKRTHSTRKGRSPLEPKLWTTTPQLKTASGSDVVENSVINGKPATGRSGSHGDRTPKQEEIPLMDSSGEFQPHQLEMNSVKNGTACEETSFIVPAKARARRPTSLTESYSLDAINTRGAKSRTPKSTPTCVNGKPSAMEERQTLLPKPDGQSPKSPREEVGMRAEKDEKRSKGSSSPSKSSLGGRSSKTLSPTRSIATPELEYDDFIMDDPLSYFEYEELGRLNWTGTEKLGRTHKRNDT